MTRRFLTTTTTALTMMLAGASVSYAEDNVAAQASDAVGEMADAGYAAAEAVTDTAQAGITALGDIAEGPYGAASDLFAQMDAAVTNDTVVRSSDDKVLGTVYGLDDDGDRVIIDLDGEMEGADQRAVENAALQVGSMTATDNGLKVNMTQEEFAASIRGSGQAKMQSEG